MSMTAEQLEYHREWRRTHPESRKKTYLKAKAKGAFRAATKRYRAKNPEKVAALRQRYKEEGRLNEYAKASRARLPPDVRAARDRVGNLKRYGLSVDGYNAMLAAQNGLCAICYEPETAMRAGRLVLLAVDHDHRTGRIRGLLCNHCNRALGAVRDKVDVLQKAIDYLQRHAT